MKPELFDAVQTTFARIEALEQEPSRVFYEELFLIAPQLRHMFAMDMDRQYRMFIMALAYCVGSLHQMESIRDNLEKLAIRHVGYGAREEHYDLIGRALMRMLTRVLKEDFTPDAREGWTRAYEIISGVMLHAARNCAAPARKAG